MYPNRSASRASSQRAPLRATVKVRNLAENVVYHLTFDGDVGRLTGTQLKQHVQSIAGIDAARQQLLRVDNNERLVIPADAPAGLRDGSVILLSLPGEGNEQPAAAAAPAPTAASKPADAPDAMTTDEEREIARQLAELQREEQRIAELRRDLEHKRELSAQRARSASENNNNAASASTAADQSNPRVVPKSRPPPRRSTTTSRARSTRDDRYTDESDDGVDVDVEEQVDSAITTTWFPKRPADRDELCLAQGDYLWRMEQVRFETERMTREREMRRQQQELEYEAALLDRQRVELERKTMLERAQFDELQTAERVDLDIEARCTPALHYAPGSVARTAADRTLSDVEVDVSAGLLP